MNEPTPELIDRCECGEMMLAGTDGLYCPRCDEEEKPWSDQQTN